MGVHSYLTPDPRKGFWEEGDEAWEFSVVDMPPSGVCSVDSITNLVADADTLIIGGLVGDERWYGEYRRVLGTTCYVLVYDGQHNGFPQAALPQGTACVLPELLGRAVLVRDPAVANNAEIMAHERAHVLAYRYGLWAKNYADNEDVADRLAARLLMGDQK